MRILFVTPYLPSPPRYGAQRRLDGLMRGLAARHEVSLLSLADSDGVSREATRAYCRELTTVDHDVQGIGLRKKRWLQLRSLASPHSFEYLLLYRPEFQARLDELLAAHDYDVVQVEFCHMAIYDLKRQRERRPLLVLDEHNIEYDLIRRTAETPGTLDRRLYSGVNWRKLRREECDAWRRFDGVALTSVRDQQLLLEDEPGTRTVVVPNAVDLETFRPSGVEPDPASLVFLGAMNYHPNIEGIHYFVETTFPKIVARYPQVKLFVVGMNPPDSVRALASERIEITGFVEDPRVYMERATVMVVPLRIGGGTRFKITESLAMGKAIVSTRLGAEGIDVEHGKHALLADDPESFAREVGRLLDDRQLVRRLGVAARELAEQRYGWAPAVAELERFYTDL